ncbi:extracellular solute-binding protein, partial [candidate division KSB1 bacterium]|nr:extracellular solute-binding protein [candidate division KSB1 bacterium]NIS25726.1 extracellular solute-binding protein [candidate division KSB1 bacterium]NIT72584.1 extracellular solute-binding protein [candidate division KSB1 bacterium]NIU26409.1 extracellular solute-binding protein [candidate division KSB1 bacterium]NIU90452.1 extracellular solute-binding protein [candidate division KSB1 bacterium]
MISKLVKSTNLLLIAVVVAGLALVLFFFTPTEPQEVDEDPSIKIYFADNISAGHKRVIDAFNEQHRGRIEVVPINLPFTKFSTNERKQLLIRSLRSKNSRVDIFAVDIFWIPRFAKWCEPLVSHFTQTELNDLLPEALQTCYYNDELVALPLYIDIGVMYYRRDLLQDLPDFEEIEARLTQSITWEEFIALSERTRLSGQPFYVFPADNYEGLICSFIETLQGQNLSLFDGGSVQLDTPEARRGLKLLVDLVNKYQMTPAAVTNFGEIDGYLFSLRNDALFFRGWPGNLKPYLNQYGNKVRNTGVAALPHFAGHKPVAVFGGWNLMISKDSGKKSEVVKFLKFATSPEMQKLLFDEMGYLPVN